MLDFNPRSREGSDGRKVTDRLTIAISIHAPVKGATKRSARSQKRRKFQSTLPRKERRDLAQMVEVLVHISIHAPMKGATDTVSARIRGFSFQSTLPRRERRVDTADITHFGISIHAPAKGATGAKAANTYATAFQPTLPRRERPGNIRT